MEQSSAATRVRTPARPSVAALGKLTVIALLGLPLLISSDLILHGLTMPGLLFTGITLTLAGIVSGVIATGWRWAPLLGAVLYGLVLLASIPVIPPALSHPSEIYLFAFNVIFLALAAVGMGAGIGATVQNNRPAAANRPAPRWLVAGLAGLAGVTLGAILVAVLAGTGTGTDAGVSPQVLATLPSVTAKDTRFAPAVLNAHVGQPVVLRLDNRDGTPHTFTIDELNVDVFMPVGKSVLAVFIPAKAGTYTITCAFHPAMQAMLTVSP